MKRPRLWIQLEHRKDRRDKYDIAQGLNKQEILIWVPPFPVKHPAELDAHAINNTCLFFKKVVGL